MGYVLVFSLQKIKRIEKNGQHIKLVIVSIFHYIVGHYRAITVRFFTLLVVSGLQCLRYCL